ncbi:MAG: hypothetical protein NUV34_07015, partial [Sulfuricaulis sp.]|nr:hypothetical protein [Sulfuricaulis sp.]
FAFDELRDMRDTEGKPIDPELAKNAARVVGGINTIIETGSEVAIASLLIPGWKQMIGGLTGTAAKQAVMTQVKTALASTTTRGVMLSALGKMTGAAAVEGLEEFIQAMVGAGGREATQAVSGQEFAPDSLAQDILGASLEAKSAFIGTFFTMGPLVAPGTYVEAKQAHRAQQQEEFFKALGDVSRETKMREHLPEKYQELVEKLTKDGPVENLNVPVEFYQSHWQNLDLDPAAVAQEMGIAEQYAEAVETGGRLEIPTAIYARRIAPTEHNNAFAAEIAVSPDAMNAREAKQRMESIDQEAEQYRQKDEETAASATRVREDILGQLKGLYPDDVAEKYAKIYEAGFTAMASRAGRDPFSVYEPYSLRVKRAIPDVLRKLGKVDNLDLLLDRMRSGESVTMEQARGQSLLQFLRKQGGLQDQGGELSARDLKKVARGLVRKKGMTLDAAAEKAMEAGYIKAHDMTELLAAIDDELAGKSRYAEGKMDAKAMETMTAMEELEQFLGSRGVDLKALDNATVKRILAGQQLMPEGQTMAQSLPDTIDIDGVQRPTKNSEGKPIAQTEEAVRNFWKWFGDSKAVDEQGMPLVLYHGTNNSFDEFDLEHPVSFRSGCS